MVGDRQDDTGAAARVGPMWDADGASRAAGVALLSVSTGHAVASMTVRADMVNGHGTCHGGFVFLLADSAFALACNTDGVPTVAQAADIVFLAPVRLGDHLVATAQERARAGRSGVYDVTVRREGQTVAEFRGQSRAVPGLTRASGR